MDSKVAKWTDPAKPIELTLHQRRIIEEAIKKAREWSGEEATEGRCVEIICVDFLESFGTLVEEE